ncbi:MAG: HD domain-containing protein [Clostridia bacterium]|nr:HD domain-containing protein [Clostridia bacterium]
MARRVARAVNAAGGRTFFVGGCVRDALMGRQIKDVDIEVHGIAPAALESILDGLGERVTMGASFGVMSLRHYDLDVAMPRSERATGRGHRDFAVFVDPFLGPEKAARRRDFTMNALMRDALTGELLDFFGGREDLKRGVLRHVDDDTFAEDPLRAFRAAQFAARFGFSVAPETVALCARMDASALAGERVMGELEKALLKAERPSVFFEELREMRQLSAWFPELEALIGVPQRAFFHPEGDAWAHTLQVLDGAAAARERAEHPLWLLLAALCHDFGKAAAPIGEDGNARGHENAGLPLARAFLARLTTETRLTEYALNMTALHMIPNTLAYHGAETLAFMEAFDRSVCPEDLILLCRADYTGRVGPEGSREALEAAYAPTEALLRGMLATYRERMARPCVMGRDLVAAGVAPGPLMGEALDCAHALRLAGEPKEKQLARALELIRRKEERP